MECTLKRDVGLKFVVCEKYWLPRRVAYVPYENYCMSFEVCLYVSAHFQ